MIVRPLTEEHLTFAVRHSDQDRKREMDQAIARLRRYGRLQQSLDRWMEFTVAVR